MTEPTIDDLVRTAVRETVFAVHAKVCASPERWPVETDDDRIGIVAEVAVRQLVKRSRASLLEHVTRAELFQIAAAEAAALTN